MKKLCMVLLALTAVAGSAQGDETYYPYQFYDDYYRQQEEAPPAAGPEAGEHPRQSGSSAQRAPLFLFPAELGFWVAAGRHEDLFYLAPGYFKVSGGVWYRAKSWRGPWLRVPPGKLPPELGRRTLTQMRVLRNREFRLFWEQKGSYRGRVFRPGLEPVQPTGKRPN
ncbi:hypothetical protein [Geomonas anaerohicana]|uniref:Uncharacterized protein n=1 Tax=Geomonas anaerohicana TaxID=2798583 RepID=A0ABS0YHJ1_9BACT|nr:hypothetical protein [Geomonas anaerohicana]MBJ6751604.1 hypothetical protein [Geomonas anaerohicana]